MTGVVLVCVVGVLVAVTVVGFVARRVGTGRTGVVGGAVPVAPAAAAARPGRGATGVVFEPEAMSAQPAVERLEPILSVWREKTPLCIECSPERMRLRLPGFYIGTAERLDAVLRIGTALE